MCTGYDSWKTRTPDEGIALDEAAFEERAFRAKRDLIIATLRLVFNPTPPDEQLLATATALCIVFGGD